MSESVAITDPNKIIVFLWNKTDKAKSKGKYYNISTNRFVMKISQNNYIFLDDVYLCGRDKNTLELCRKLLNSVIDVRCFCGSLYEIKAKSYLHYDGIHLGTKDKLRCCMCDDTKLIKYRITCEHIMCNKCLPYSFCCPKCDLYKSSAYESQNTSPPDYMNPVYCKECGYVDDYRKYERRGIGYNPSRYK